MDWLDWIIAFVGFMAGALFGFILAAIFAATGDADGPSDPTYWWEG